MLPGATGIGVWLSKSERFVMENALAIAEPFQVTPHALQKVGVRPKAVNVGGQRLWIKGVTYGSFSPNEEGEPFLPLAQLR